MTSSVRWSYFTIVTFFCCDLRISRWSPFKIVKRICFLSISFISITTFGKKKWNEIRDSKIFYNQHKWVCIKMSVKEFHDVAGKFKLVILFHFICGWYLEIILTKLGRRFMHQIDYWLWQWCHHQRSISSSLTIWEIQNFLIIH